MEDPKVEKQSKRTISYLVGAAVSLIALMLIALFLLLNWAQTSLQVQEMKEETTIEENQTTP